MKNKKKVIFYWSPCLNPVGTINSTLNSASALIKYVMMIMMFISLMLVENGISILSL